MSGADRSDAPIVLGMPTARKACAAHARWWKNSVGPPGRGTMIYDLLCIRLTLPKKARIMRDVIRLDARASPVDAYVDVVFGRRYACAAAVQCMMVTNVSASRFARGVVRVHELVRTMSGRVLHAVTNQARIGSGALVWAADLGCCPGQNTSYSENTSVSLSKRIGPANWWS